MLSSLVIRDVVLIDALVFEGGPGLCVLTGETGAGKSILLDALGLALGARADAGLVRKGAEQASAAAAFDLPRDHPLRATLAEKGIPAESGLILRRVVGKDGRGKAFINDIPVTVQFLKETAAALVEVHGQFETQGLLDPATHRAALDGYAGLSAAPVEKAWAAWRAARDARDRADGEIAALRAQEDYLRHSVAELEKLDPVPGEEAALAEKRTRLMNAGKLRAAAAQAEKILDADDGVFALLGRLQVLLDKAGASAALEPVARAKAELEDASYRIGRLDASGADNLEAVEERYFALKAAAKKHRVMVDDLPRLRDDFARKLRLVSDQDAAQADLEKAAAAARDAYAALAEKLSAQRVRAAVKMSRAVQAELPDLKLDKATFQVEVARADEHAWGPQGLDRVVFTISTNKGAAAGPLHKIASGGELARFMLALKVVLAASGAVSTLIFDEVDSGIGGGAADAVGARLARLAATYQVLVVTHSPQVAARAAHHWRVAKADTKGAVMTRITPLSTLAERREEIARMLSGAVITPEARAQAARLLETRDAA